MTRLTCFENIRYFLAIVRNAILLPIFIFPFLLFGQIDGNVVNEKNEGLAFAAVVIYKQQDSVVIQGTVADDKGYFSFKPIPVGRYMISCRYVGYEDGQYPIDIQNDGHIDRINLILKESLLQLDGIEINAFKVLLKRENDKLIFDTQKLKKNSGDALSLIEITPGIIFNKSGQSILFNGRSDIGIMLNGKFLGNSTEAALQVLSSIPSEDVIRIEVIDNPPLQYSSHGSALLNIVTKAKSDKISNVSVNGNLGYGNGSKSYLSVGGFKDLGKVYTSINYTYGFNSTKEIWQFSRTVNDDSSFNNSDRKAKVFSHAINLEIIYEIDSTLTVGGDFNGFIRQWDMLAINQTNSNLNGVRYFVNSEDKEMDRWDNYLSSIYLKKKFNEKTSINLEFDYLTYKNRNDHDYQNNYKYSDGTILDEQVTLRKETPIQVLVSNFGFNSNLSARLNLTGGFRFSKTKFTNVYESKNEQNNSKNTYEDNKIDESIVGAWISSAYKMNQFQAEIGTRMEYTVLSVNNNATDEKLVYSKFNNFFPFISLSNRISERLSISAGFNRRISRQPYASLAPFVVYQGPDVIYTGNVLLSPAYSNNFFVDLSFADYAVSLKYKSENNTIEKYQPFLNRETNVLEVKPLNYERSQKISFSLAKSFILFEKLRLQLNNLLMWDCYSDSRLYGEEISINNLSLNSSGLFSLALSKGFDIQISANYRTPLLTGFNINRSPGFVNFTVQKQIRQCKFTFSVEDIFSTNNWSIRSELNKINAMIRSDYSFENPIFKIGFIYDLKNVKLKRQSHDGPEEKKRL